MESSTPQSRRATMRILRSISLPRARSVRIASFTISIILIVMAVVATIWVWWYQAKYAPSFSITQSQPSIEFQQALYEAEAGVLFENPTCLAVSPKGWLFVADAGAQETNIYVFNENRQYIHTIRDNDYADYGFSRPVSMTASTDGKLYLIDSNSQWIIGFDSDLVPYISASFNEEDPLSVTAGFDQQGEEVIYATTRSGIAILTPELEVVTGYYDFGSQLAQFDTPLSVIASQDASNTVYIVDSLNYRVQAITSLETSPVVAWTYGSPLPKGQALRYDGEDRKFGLPVAAGKGPANQLFVLDGLSSQVVVLDSRTGQYLRTISKPGSEDGSTRFPTSMAVFDDKIFVADKGNKRVSIFSNIPGRAIPAKTGSLPDLDWVWWLVGLSFACAAGLIVTGLARKAVWVTLAPDAIDEVAIAESRANDCETLSSGLALIQGPGMTTYINSTLGRAIQFAPLQLSTGEGGPGFTTRQSGDTCGESRCSEVSEPDQLEAEAFMLAETQKQCVVATSSQNLINLLDKSGLPYISIAQVLHYLSTE